MKHTLSILLAASLALTLCACASDAENPASTDESPSQSQSAQPSPSDEPSQSVQPSPSDEPSQSVPPSEDAEAPESAASETIVTFVPSDFNPVLGETADAGQEYIDKITFLGDSTTYGLRYYKMLTGERDTTQVWTPASGTLSLFQQSFALIVYPETDEEITILEAVTRKKPEIMVITLGVNGVSMMDEDYFKREYTSLVQGIQQTSPETKIILQSIFPVAASYEHLDSINNENISQANQWVQAVAAETGVHYLNTQSVLVGEDGWLPESYQNGDGMHLNETSFAVVLDYIRTHALP